MAAVKGLLFDLDGVLVDAMALHEEAFLAALRAQGGIDLSQQEHSQDFAGLPTKVKLRRLVELGRLDARKVSAISEAKQLFTLSYAEQKLRTDPQRMYLLEHFTAHGMKLGCVTNCIKRTATELLERTGLLQYVEECLVTNEDVSSPKPHPEPYSKACGILGLEPSAVVAIEDHPVGIESAQKAGCHTMHLLQWEHLTIDNVWDAIQKAELAAREAT